jgi:hypothetical protein
MSKGIPGELAKSKISGQWIHSFAAPAAKPFLTISPQAQEKQRYDRKPSV